MSPSTMMNTLFRQSKMIFVDTSALLAIFDKSDINHLHAVQCWKDLLKKASPLLANNYILVESIAIIQKRFGLEAVQSLQSEILPFVQTDWIDERQHAAIVERMLATNRRRLSLMDCAAFETMQWLDISTIFTFDKHFHEQGFNVIP